MAQIMRQILTSWHWQPSFSLNITVFYKIQVLHWVFCSDSDSWTNTCKSALRTDPIPLHGGTWCEAIFYDLDKVVFLQCFKNRMFEIILV